MKKYFYQRQGIVFFCACFALLLLSFIALWSTGIGVVHADFSDSFVIEEPLYLPFYRTRAENGYETYLATTKLSLSGDQESKVQIFLINGIITNYNPSLNTINITHNGTAYEVPVSSGGAFSLQVTFQLGFNIIGLEYNNEVAYFVRTCQAPNGGLLTGKVNTTTFTAEPNAVVDLDSYGDHFAKVGTRAVLKQCRFNYSDYTIETDIIGNYPIEKTNEGSIIKTDLPLDELSLTTDMNKYILEVLDSKGNITQRLQLRTNVIEQLPSVNPSRALFYSPLIDIKDAYFTLEDRNTNYKIKEILNGSFFEIPFDSIPSRLNQIPFEISDGVNMYSEYVFYKRENAGSRYKSVLTEQFKNVETTNARVKPTIIGHVDNYDPAFMNVKVIVNGLQIPAPLNDKGDFKVELPLRNGYNVIHTAYGDCGKMYMQKFNMPTVGKLEPQLSIDKSSVLTEVPLKFTLPSNVRIKLPLKLKLYHADYAKENSNITITQLGEYNVKKNKTIYETVEAIDLKKLTGRNTSFCGFELLDAKNQSLGHFAVNYSNIKTEFVPSLGVYKVATIFVPYNDVYLNRDQLQPLDVSDYNANGVFTLTRDIYEAAKNFMYFDLKIFDQYSSTNSLSSHLPITATPAPKK